MAETETDFTPEELEAGAGGRPPFEPTAADRVTVARMAATGVPQEIIRLAVVNPQTGEPVTRKTLRKHFGEEINMGLALFGADLLTIAAEIAKDKNHQSCAYMNQFLLKTRVGLKETSVTELVGGEGQPLAWPQLVIIRNGNDDSPATEAE